MEGDCKTKVRDTSIITHLKQITLQNNIQIYQHEIICYLTNSTDHSIFQTDRVQFPSLHNDANLVVTGIPIHL